MVADEEGRPVSQAGREGAGGGAGQEPVNFLAAVPPRGRGNGCEARLVEDSSGVRLGIFQKGQDGVGVPVDEGKRVHPGSVEGFVQIFRALSQE